MSEEAVDDRRVGGFEWSARSRPGPRPRAALPLGRRRGLRVGWGCPHGLLLLVGSTASDGPCAARSVWVRRRAAMTRSDGVDGRPMRNATSSASSPLPGLASKRSRGSKGSYALRAFDDTRDLKDSRRRRNPALDGVSPTHNNARSSLILRLVGTLIKLLLLGPLLLALLD